MQFQRPDCTTKNCGQLADVGVDRRRGWIVVDVVVIVALCLLPTRRISDFNDVMFVLNCQFAIVSTLIFFRNINKTDEHLIARRTRR
jgi:hypothetical protein